MLALQQHFSECTSCEAERRSIRQVKALLRALHEPRPRPDLPAAISLRLSEAEQPLWRVLSLSAAPAWPPRPQRGRRLATALALSCLTVFSFAAACFAPAPRDGALTSAGFFFPTGLTPPHPALTNEDGPMLLTNPPRNDFLSLAGADGARRERLFTGPSGASAPPEMRLSPFPEAIPPGYSQGATAFAAYRTP